MAFPLHIILEPAACLARYQAVNTMYQEIKLKVTDFTQRDKELLETMMAHPDRNRPKKASPHEAPGDREPEPTVLQPSWIDSRQKGRLQTLTILSFRTSLKVKNFFRVHTTVCLNQVAI